ncbi:hypothetical protein B0J14DRAFT_593488 [Halenospora varia]|nr:hypothetical protein B0J14DRAFT_593488 [Halenospora varia]
MSVTKNIAFFGATGGTAAATLAQCLLAGYNCTALVRSASKLTNLLKTSHSIPAETLDKQLTIIQGNIKSIDDCTQTVFPAALNPPTSRTNNRSVDIIVSCIGSIPVWKGWNPIPSIEDPTVCAEGTNAILTALRNRQPVKKPVYCAMSTTGISKYGRDVPLVFAPLYYVFLHIPHKDKKIMENLVIEGASNSDKGQQVISEYNIIRASLLTSGAQLGREHIRWEVEDGAVTSKAIGYTISRADVGNFIFEEVVEKWDGSEVKAEGKGRIFTVTY